MRDERAEPYTDQVPEHERFESFHIIEPGGTLRWKGDAGVRLAGILIAPGFERRLRSLHLVGVVGFVYRMISINRGRLGRIVRDTPGPVRWP